MEQVLLAGGGNAPYQHGTTIHSRLLQKTGVFNQPNGAYVDLAIAFGFSV